MAVKRFFCTMILLALAAGTAVAQTQTVDVTMTEPTFIQTLWANIQQPLTVILTGVITAAAGWLAVKVNTFFNVTNKAQQQANEIIIRNIIHDAAWSAVKWSQQKTGITLSELQAPGLPPANFIREGIEYVRSKNPDVAALMSDKDLGEVLVSKVPDLIKVMTPDVTVAPVAVVVPEPVK